MDIARGLAYGIGRLAFVFGILGIFGSLAISDMSALLFAIVLIVVGYGVMWFVN